MNCKFSPLKNLITQKINLETFIDIGKIKRNESILKLGIFVCSTVAAREGGYIGLFITLLPYFITLSWFIKFSVQTFQPLIVIHRFCISSLGMYINLFDIVLSFQIPVSISALSRPQNNALKYLLLIPNIFLFLQFKWILQRKIISLILAVDFTKNELT